MFSKSLLPTIRGHEFFLFKGISGWPASTYGNDYADFFLKRTVREMLSDDQSNNVREFKENSSPTAFTITVSEEGVISIEDSSGR